MLGYHSGRDDFILLADREENSITANWLNAVRLKMYVISEVGATKIWFGTVARTDFR